MAVVPPYHLSKIWCLWSHLTIWCHNNARLQPYDLVSQERKAIALWLVSQKRKIWCLWSPLTIWAKFDACGRPLPFEQNLMAVVPPYYLSKIWCLWSALTIWVKFDACGPPLPFEENLMPVVPPYHLVSQERKATALWFGVTRTKGYSLMIWCHKRVKFDGCCPPLPFGVTRTQGYSLMIWCQKTAKFDACGPPLPFEQNLMAVVPPYYLSKIWCLWSPLTIWVKFDACGPPLPFEQNLMPVVPPYHLSKIWCLWSPPYHLVSQERKAVALWFGVRKTQGYSLMIWCHKNARL